MKLIDPDQRPAYVGSNDSVLYLAYFAAAKIVTSRSTRTGSKHDGRRSLASARRQTNSSTVSVLKVLNQIASKPSGHTVRELGDRLEMSRNMIVRALSTLGDLGYVIRDESGRNFRLGWNALSFCNPQTTGADFRLLCSNYLRRIQQVTGETVAFTIPIGFNTATIDGMEGHAERVGRIEWGISWPLHGSVAGRVILSCFSNDEVERYVETMKPLRQRTGKVMSASRLREEIDSIRRNGYGLSIKEYVPTDSQHVSFAVLDVSDRPHGAITISGPAERLSLARIDQLLPAILRLVKELNEQSRTFPSMANGFV